MKKLTNDQLQEIFERRMRASTEDQDIEDMLNDIPHLMEHIAAVHEELNTLQNEYRNLLELIVEE